jgi:RHS repeat-associated protein
VDGDGQAFTLNLRFPGQYFDEETGTHYNYFRDYDPGVGRYVQSDPIGLAGGLNTYGYAYQNPLVNFDPDGRVVLFWAAGAIATAGTVWGIIVVSDAFDSLMAARDNAEDYHQDTFDAANCVLTGTCDPEPLTERAAQHREDFLRNAADGIEGLGSTIPGTSITGPIPTSALDAVLNGAGNLAGAAASCE